MSSLPATFQERVREKIGQTIAELIDPTDLDKIIDAGVAEFMQRDLPGIVREELTKRFGAVARVEIDSMLQTDWCQIGSSGEYGHSPRGALKQIIAEVAPDVWQAMISQLIGQTVMNLRNSLPRY